MKFSENVRLADNSAGSVQSSGVKLALALGKANTSGVTNVYADLVSLEGDTAVFSYRVPGKITIGTGNNKKDEKMDFYVSGVVSLKRLLNQSILKSWSSKMIKKSLEAYFFTLKNKIVFCKKQF